MTPGKRLTIREKIMEAMGHLEQMPCGGVGRHGPTKAELEDCERAGHVYIDNAEYHQTQQAWLCLGEALKLL